MPTDPPTDPRASSPTPASRGFPTAAGPSRLRDEFAKACEPHARRGRRPARRGHLVSRARLGRARLRPRDRRRRGRRGDERVLRLRLLRRGTARAASRPTSRPSADFTDVIVEDNPDWEIDLNEEVIGPWRGEGERARRRHPGLGHADGPGRRRGDRRARRRRRRPDAGQGRALHAGRASTRSRASPTTSTSRSCSGTTAASGSPARASTSRPKKPDRALDPDPAAGHRGGDQPRDDRHRRAHPRHRRAPLLPGDGVRGRLRVDPGPALRDRAGADAPRPRQPRRRQPPLRLDRHRDGRRPARRHRRLPLPPRRRQAQEKRLRGAPSPPTSASARR